VYGLSKAAGETAVREVYSEGSYIVRTAWLYSEFGKNFAKTMCRLAIESNKEVKVVSDQVGQPSNANDLARQLIKLVKTNANFGTYHGTNAGQASWYEFANQIFKLCGADTGRLISVPTSEFPRSANRPNNSVLGHSAWDAVGIPPMQDWKTALEQSMPGILASVQMEE
jgi:dTDP-4-dehydrorhamnose reductase